jgi:5-methylcytosine-specific restriction protein B
MALSQLSVTDVFVLRLPRDDPGNDDDTLYLSIRDTDAKARLTEAEFVVLKGSICSKDVTPHAKEAPFARKRAKMITDGIIQERDGRLVLAENFNFNSPSGASCVLSGRNTNGWVDWKNADGKSLKEMKREE